MVALSQPFGPLIVELLVLAQQAGVSALLDERLPLRVCNDPLVSLEQQLAAFWARNQ